MKWAIALVGLWIPALTACDDYLEGNDDMVTENRTVAEFDAVDASNGVDVFLTVDPSPVEDVVLAVTTDPNLQKFLTTEMTDGTFIETSDSGRIAAQ